MGSISTSLFGSRTGNTSESVNVLQLSYYIRSIHAALSHDDIFSVNLIIHNHTPHTVCLFVLPIL